MLVALLLFSSLVFTQEVPKEPQAAPVVTDQPATTSTSQTASFGVLNPKNLKYDAQRAEAIYWAAVHAVQAEIRPEAPLRAQIAPEVVLHLGADVLLMRFEPRVASDGKKTLIFFAELPKWDEEMWAQACVAAASMNAVPLWKYPLLGHQAVVEATSVVDVKRLLDEKDGKTGTDKK